MPRLVRLRHTAGSRARPTNRPPQFRPHGVWGKDDTRWGPSRILIILATVLGLTTAGFVPSAQAAVHWTQSEARGPNHTSRVVLSYDDCPKTLTSFKKVVHYAKKKNIGLVIAPTGGCLVKYKKKVRR